MRDRRTNTSGQDCDQFSRQAGRQAWFDLSLKTLPPKLIKIRKTTLLIMTTQFHQSLPIIHRKWPHPLFGLPWEDLSLFWDLWLIRAIFHFVFQREDMVLSQLIPRCYIAGKTSSEPINQRLLTDICICIYCVCYPATSWRIRRTNVIFCVRFPISFCLYLFQIIYRAIVLS